MVTRAVRKNLITGVLPATTSSKISLAAGPSSWYRNFSRRPAGLSEVLLSRSIATSQRPAWAWYSTQFSSGMLLTSS
jgi:hypothetical protein